jgi:hypothetical protein
MIGQSEKQEIDILSPRDRNKYVVLDEVRSFMEFNGVCWDHLFQLLFKANGGCLNYDFGDVSIDLSRNWGVNLDDEDDNSFQLSIEVKRDGSDNTASYEYKIKEIAELRKGNQSTLQDFGE